MVFQIADDALDLVADEETIGKPAGSDIREGTFTVPVCSPRAGRPEGPDPDLLEAPMPYSDEAVEEVIDLVRSGGHIEESSAGGDHDGLKVATEALSAVGARASRGEILEELGGIPVGEGGHGAG